MASEHICAICQDVVKEAASAPCCPEQVRASGGPGCAGVLCVRSEVPLWVLSQRRRRRRCGLLRGRQGGGEHAARELAGVCILAQSAGACS